MGAPTQIMIKQRLSCLLHHCPRRPAATLGCREHCSYWLLMTTACGSTWCNDSIWADQAPTSCSLLLSAESYTTNSITACPRASSWFGQRRMQSYPADRSVGVRGRCLCYLLLSCGPHRRYPGVSASASPVAGVRGQGVGMPGHGEARSPEQEL